MKKELNTAYRDNLKKGRIILLSVFIAQAVSHFSKNFHDEFVQKSNEATRLEERILYNQLLFQNLTDRLIQTNTTAIEFGLFKKMLTGSANQTVLKDIDISISTLTVQMEDHSLARLFCMAINANPDMTQEKLVVQVGEWKKLDQDQRENEMDKLYLE